MIPVHSSPEHHLANARCVVQGLQDGYLRVTDLPVLRKMVMDIRAAVLPPRSASGGPILVEAWLAQATEILDAVVYRGRPFDDLDLGALKECLTEAACVLRVAPVSR